MGIIRQMTFGAGVSVGAAGVSLARQFKDAPPKLEVLEKQVVRTLRRQSVDPETKTKLSAMLQNKDRKGLTAELSRLDSEGKAYFSDARVQYSEGDVAKMRSATEGVLENVNQYVDRLDALIPSTVKARSVEKNAAFLQGVLEKFDAKYKNVDRKTLEARVTEVTVVQFFRGISKLTDQQLKVFGLDSEQIGKAQALRTQLKTEKRAARAEGKTPKKTGSITLYGDGASRRYRTGMQTLDSGRVAFKLETTKDNKITGSGRDPGKMSGYEVMEKLGIDLSSITPPMLAEIADLTARKDQRYAGLAKDFLKVFKSKGRTLAKAAVNGARIKQIEPSSYVEAARELNKIVDELSHLAMAGRDTSVKLLQTKEVHACLALILDELLADGDLNQNFRKRIEDPKTFGVIDAMIRSEDVGKVLGGIKENLNRVTSLLGEGR